MSYPRICVLEPRHLWWERLGVFNPAVIEHNNKTYMIYRAYGTDHISRFGLAISDDGVNFQTFDLPIVDALPDDPYERLGIEDPRVVFIDGYYYITYTMASVYSVFHKGHSAQSLNTPGVSWRVRSAVMRTKDFIQFERLNHLFKTIDTKNSILFPRKINNKFYLLHRINPNIYLDSATRLDEFTGGVQILEPKSGWEELKVGGACPPIETKDGWLVTYHGVSRDLVYSIGVILLDLNNPHKVLKRSSRPFLTPQETWEKDGYIKNVVFLTSCIEKGDLLYFYYGAADRAVGLTKVPIKDILDTLE